MRLNWSDYNLLSIQIYEEFSYIFKNNWNWKLHFMEIYCFALTFLCHGKLYLFLILKEEELLSRWLFHFSSKSLGFEWDYVNIVHLGQWKINQIYGSMNCNKNKYIEWCMRRMKDSIEKFRKSRTYFRNKINFIN